MRLAAPRWIADASFSRCASPPDNSVVLWPSWRPSPTWFKAPKVSASCQGWENCSTASETVSSSTYSMANP